MNNLINQIKYYLNNIKKQNLFFIIGILVVVVLVIIFISAFVKTLNKRISYEKLEETLARAAEKYTSDNPTNLPTEENPTTVISATTLIENKYLKNLKRYVKDSSCTANINIYYNEGNYEYIPFLTCNSFKTEKLSDVLKEKDEISSFGDGLYEMNNEFVYRGQNPNNYLKFNDQLWRIVKVNNQGKIIIIEQDMISQDNGVWDNRYNTDKDSQKGINNFDLSRILITLRAFYQERYEKYNNYLTKFDLCSNKRSEIETNKDGLVECSKISKDQIIGLLPVYDYMNASLDPLCSNTSSKECQNYNYLVNEKYKWWTATGNDKNTYEVYYVDYYGQIVSEEAYTNGMYRYILAFDKNVLYKQGTGTIDDPFEIR